MTQSPDRMPWTAEDDANLLAMLKERMPKRQIARIIGRAESSVHSRAAILGKKTTQRPCMCCGKQFASEGAHNRLCNKCRFRAKDVSPYAH